MTRHGIVIEILGLPLAVQIDSARPLRNLGSSGRSSRTQSYRGLNKTAARRGVKLDIKAPPAGTAGFTSTASSTPSWACAWLQSAAQAYPFARLEVEPA